MVQLSTPGYVRAALHYFQHKRTKQSQDSPYPWTQIVYENNNQMLPEKSPAEELDKYNKKIPHKQITQFLNYSATYPYAIT